MSNTLKTAYASGWNLALTLMVTVTVFQAENGQFGIVPSVEYDGDTGAVIHEFDPFTNGKCDGSSKVLKLTSRYI